MRALVPCSPPLSRATMTSMAPVMLLDDAPMVLLDDISSVKVTPTLMLARSELDKQFGEMFIYFPLYFTGFAVLILGLQAVLSLFTGRNRNKFD